MRDHHLHRGKQADQIEIILSLGGTHQTVVKRVVSHGIQCEGNYRIA
jgi:hypothetical protein